MADAPSELHLGLAITKTEDDRSKWTVVSSEVAEEHVVPWEDDGALSHFAGVVAAMPHTDGKSQVERFVITGADVAQQWDGRRVIFARVVEGLPLVQRIISDAAFPSEQDERAGRGAPQDDIRVKAVTVR
jgi:hypothetical protein